MPSLNDFIEAFLFPPGLFIFLIVLGLLIRPLFKKLSTTLIFISVVSLYLASTPLVGQLSLRSLETYPALSESMLGQPQTQPPQAIVVLGGGRYANAAEYGGRDTVSIHSLLRLRYGAWLHRKTGLPLLVSGGIVEDDATVSEAQLMAEVLQQEMGITQVWQEGDSRNTHENAYFSNVMLSEGGIKSIYLVTEAAHMPRAVESFRKQGLQVTPAPTILTPKPGDGLDILLPTSGALARTRFAMHEYIGRWWYRIRYAPSE